MATPQPRNDWHTDTNNAQTHRHTNTKTSMHQQLNHPRWIFGSMVLRWWVAAEHASVTQQPFSSTADWKSCCLNTEKLRPVATGPQSQLQLINDGGAETGARPPSPHSVPPLLPPLAPPPRHLYLLPQTKFNSINAALINSYQLQSTASYNLFCQFTFTIHSIECIVVYL